MKDVKVGMTGLWYENLWEWNLSWRRNWFKWEKPIVQDLYQELESCKPKKDLDDIWFWLGDRNGSYTVKSTYNKIRNDMRGDNDKLFFKLWTIKALPYAQIFYWRVLLDKLSTAGNLVKVGIQGINNMCVFCQNQEKTISHLLFTCHKVSKI